MLILEHEAEYQKTHVGPIVSLPDLTRDEIEQPSGKNAAYENFPVGSWLLPARLRQHIATFYAFARTIDDIADSTTLSAEEKIDRLDGFARHLNDDIEEPGYDKAVSMRKSLVATRIPVTHCMELVAAFKQDATKQRYESWNDLLAYCRLSAAPVGRYLIDLHDGCRDNYASSDALCSALQIINHLQDMGDDYRQLDRVYMPTDWISDAGVTDHDFAEARCSPGVRQITDRALDGTGVLLGEAKGVSRKILSTRLSMEASVILKIADALCKKLRMRDPLARRVVLRKPELVLCGVKGILSGIMDMRTYGYPDGTK